MTHTPGPWTPHGTIITREGDNSEYPVAGVLGYLPDEEAYANARLIAAAPELLSALESLAPMFDNDSPLLTVYSTQIEEARTAIAKATG